MITAAAPAWLRRSDQAVTWARTMLTPRCAVVIDCETTDLPGALLATTVIRTCGIAPERGYLADGKTLRQQNSQPRTGPRRPENGIPSDA